VNEPSGPVVTVDEIIAVDRPLSVVVLVAYSWMVAPEIGLCPPCTTPEIFSAVVCPVGGPIKSPPAHPESKKKKQAKREAARKTEGRLDKVTTSQNNLSAIGGPVKQTFKFLI
jgi:hypothetical protein